MRRTTPTRVAQFALAVLLGLGCSSQEPPRRGGPGPGAAGATGAVGSTNGGSPGAGAPSTPTGGAAGRGMGGAAGTMSAEPAAGTNGVAGNSAPGGNGAGANAAGGNGAGGSAGAVGGGATSAGMAGASTETYPVPTTPPADEDGSSLWLRYPLVSLPSRLAEYRSGLRYVVKAESSATLKAAESELVKGIGGLTGSTVMLADAAADDGAVVLGTPDSSTLVKSLGLDLAGAGSEGYVVRAATVSGHSAIVVAANTDIGVLYGSFALLRQLECHRTLQALALTSAPKIQHRILEHWDNLDGSVERGYAGKSLWNWSALPATLSPRYTDYARANASIGVNGVVLNNVNADAQILTSSYLDKIAALANVFRPYGIRVYVSAQFGAPAKIGGLSTNDPLDSSVKKWWTDLANSIYQKIPDFGGFLVKANSEGQPGPADYGRTHADGANTLAAALAPHDGIVLWRAFVYKDDGSDRIGQAYAEFKPLDGKFASNAIVQVKNGPLDFQPREPFSPLFGAMPKTPLALEVQVTKEYLGEDTHLVYLGSLYEEVLKTDTQVSGPGSTVARVIDGSLHGYTVTAMGGVANVGSDTNWTGSHFNQANWYAFGRLAWDPDATARDIADEWIRQTFSNDPVVVAPVTTLMLDSRQNAVNYMTPLGLAHIMGTDDHYGPAPWINNLSQADWNPYYFHKADATGIGFDRTSTGSNSLAQYSTPVETAYASRSTVPDDFLLFFQRVKWDDKLASSGRTLWEELVYRYSLGVDSVQIMKNEWAMVQGRIDAKRYGDVTSFLQTQHYEARWWRDACLAYFSSVSKHAIPSGYAMPAQSLSFYQNLETKCPSDVTKPRCNDVYTGNPSPAITP